MPGDLSSTSEGDVINSILRVSISGEPSVPAGKAEQTTDKPLVTKTYESTNYNDLEDDEEGTAATKNPGKETEIVQECPDTMGDDESGSDDEPGAKKKGVNQGRRKIDIEFIDDKNKRHITFSKRKAGIMKKAYELSTLTDTQVLLLVVSETGLVYTYTTPRLQPLVSGKRGKNLIQQCLVAPTQTDLPQTADGVPLVDYPEPKVRQYAPNGRRVSQPRTPVKKRSQQALSIEASLAEYVPPVPAIPQEHQHHNQHSPRKMPAVTTSAVSDAMPPIPSTSSAAFAPIPSSVCAAPLTPHRSPRYADPLSLPQTDLFSGLPTPVFHYGTVPQQPLYGLREGCNPALPDQVSPPMFDYSLSPFGSDSDAITAVGIPSSVSNGTRTLKKRKTTENLKSKKSNSNIKESAAKILDASEKAAKALNQARANPCIETLMKAFHLQQEAQEQAENKPRGAMSPRLDRKAVHPISTTLSELQMALTQLSAAQYNGYRQNGLYYGRLEPLQLSSPVEAFVPLFSYFFDTHVVNVKAEPDTVAQYAIDATAFAAWLLGHAFIGNSIHAALSRFCAARKLSTPKLNGAITQTLGQLPNGHAPQPPIISSAYDFGAPRMTYTPEPADYARTIVPMPLQQATSVQQVSTRVTRAERVLSEYCTFARNRYKAHFDQKMPILQGTFIVLAIAASFLLLDDVTVSADRDFLDSEAPFKVRTSPILNSVLRRGDRLSCALQKALGASFWLPTSGGNITGNHMPDADAEYIPDPDLHAYEMEKCRLSEDHVGFAIAFAAHNKANRADQLLAMGEFADEGFTMVEM